MEYGVRRGIFLNIDACDGGCSELAGLPGIRHPAGAVLCLRAGGCHALKGRGADGICINNVEPRKRNSSAMRIMAGDK